MSKSAIQAVVFDWAGTMIDFGCRAPVLALREVFAEAGIEITEAEARADMGKAKRDHVRALLVMPRIAGLWQARYGAVSAEVDVDRLHDAVEPKMRVAAGDRATLIPGAARIVADLRASGVKIGSTTGYTRPMMADILPLAAEPRLRARRGGLRRRDGGGAAFAADDVEGPGRAGRLAGGRLRQGR
jgi:phosphonoacetaldehyde hydrolase